MYQNSIFEIFKNVLITLEKKLYFINEKHSLFEINVFIDNIMINNAYRFILNMNSYVIKIEPYHVNYHLA